MSVVNVSGFSENEILSAKKISATGFATEYMLVQSSSRDIPSSDTNQAGKLYLIRGYRSGSIGESGSLGGTPNLSQSYEPGQVIVSTGKINTGFIRLNANPNDSTTPYMDIVERTGSGVYDVELKARLGDLSGLSSGLLYGNSSPGFGLFTENVFLQGAITAQTGSIQGILHIRTDLSNQIHMGTNVKNSLDGFYLNNNNFWYTTGDFRVGDTSDNYIYISGSSMDIKSGTFTLEAGNLDIDSSAETIRLGDVTDFAKDGSAQGILMGKESSGNYDLFVGKEDGNYIHWDDSAAALTVTGTINISSGTGFATPASVSGSFASPASVSGSFATPAGVSGSAQQYSEGAVASGSAYASGSANEVQDNLTSISQSFETTVSASTSDASTAQAAIDAMETQVVLDSAGMGLWNAAGSVQVAEYGTTSTFWDGVGHADANRKLELNASGITLWGSDNTDYLNIAAGSLSMYAASGRKLHITDDGINIGPSATGPSSAGSPSAVIGNISLHSGGAHIYGNATNTYTSITSAGMETYLSNVKTSIIGSTTVIGSATAVTTTSTDDCIRISDGSIKLFEDANNYTDITASGSAVWAGGIKTAIFGATTAIGSDTAVTTTSTDSVLRLDSTGAKAYYDANNYTHFHSAGTDIYHGGDKMAIFGTTTVIGSDVAVTATSTDSVIRLDSTGVKIFEDSGSRLEALSDGMHLYSGGNKVSQFGSTVTVGNTSDAYMTLNSTEFAMFDEAAAQLVTLNSGRLTLGGTDGNTDQTAIVDSGGFYSYYDASNYSHVHSAGLDVYHGGDKMAIFGTISVIGSSTAVTTTSTDDCIRIADGTITVFRQDSEKAILDGSGLSVYDGSTSLPNAVFGATTYVGLQASEHIKITATKLELKRGSETFVSASSAGLYTSGSINANTGIVGGWTIAGSTLTGTNVTLASSGNLTLGTSDNVVRLSSDDGTYRLWTGHATAGSAPFRVHKDGTLTATGADITGTISITSGDLAGVDATTISGSANTFSASLALASQSMATQVKLDSNGMTLNQADGTTLASYGATVTLGQSSQAHQTITSTNTTFYDSGGASSATERLVISNDGTIVLKDSGGVTKVSATTTGVRVTGDNTDDYLDVVSDAINVVAEGDTVASFGATTTVGITGNNEYVNIDGNGVKVYGGSATTYAEVDADSFNIVSAGQLSASFGTNTSIGPTGGNHVLINSDGINIKNSSTTYLSASADGLYMTGDLHSSHGVIGGWIIGTKLSSTNISLDPTVPMIQLGGKESWYANTNGIFIGGTGSTVLGGYAISVGSAEKFVVDAFGALTASSAIISGDLTADTITANTAGNMAGFRLGANILESTGSSAGTGIKLDTSTTNTITIGDFDGQRMFLDGARSTVSFHDSGGTEILKIGSSLTQNYSGYGHGMQITKGALLIYDGASVSDQIAPSFEVHSIRASSLEADSYSAYFRMEANNNNSYNIYATADGNGSNFSVNHYNIYSTVQGSNYQASNTSYGIYCGVSGVGTTGTAYGGKFVVSQYGSVQPTNMYGIHVSTGVADNTYGVYIDADAGYGLYVADGESYFAEHISIASGQKIYPISGDATTYIQGSGNDIYMAATDDLYFQPDSDIRIEVGTTEYVRFDGSEKSVGIGTTAPGAPLHVYSDTNNLKALFDTGADIHTRVYIDTGNGTSNRNAELTYLQNGSAYWTAGMFGLDYGIQNSAAGNVFPFYIENGADHDALYIDSGGQVGIGDDSPDYPLDVEGHTSNISIYAEYDIAAYSDIRVKTDIETITKPLSKVLKMRGVTFRRIDSDLDKRQMGVIAQEIEDIVPEVVNTIDSPGSKKDGHKSVSYGNLTALLIEAIKEQQEQIEELKQEVKEIKDAVSK